MDRILAGVLVGLVFGMVGAASAQDATVESVQKQDFPAQPQARGETKAPDGTVPPPPHAQPQAPLGDLAKPAAVGPAQANTAGSMASDIPPGATPQTMPSTLSAENAALDKLPIGALQLPLSAEERDMIAARLKQEPDTGGGSGPREAGVTAFLPVEAALAELPADIADRVPEARLYKYVKRPGVILLVDPPNKIVVGEIPL